MRREQYLPIVVPWNGICNDNWIESWLEVYEKVGLDLYKRPLGPLLPAPRIDGSFFARPLTTAEAACWCVHCWKVPPIGSLPGDTP